MRDLFSGYSGTYDFRRHANCNRIRRDVAAHHTPRAYHTAFAHMGAIEKNCIRSHPDIVFNGDTLARGALLADRHIGAIKVVVLRMKAHVLAHDHVLADRNKAGAAEEGISVDGGIGPHADTFTQIGCGRAHDHRISANLYVVAQDHAFAHEAIDDHAAFECHAFAKANERCATEVHVFGHEHGCDAALQEQEFEYPTHQPCGAPDEQSQQQ